MPLYFDCNRAVTLYRNHAKLLILTVMYIKQISFSGGVFHNILKGILKVSYIILVRISLLPY